MKLTVLGKYGPYEKAGGGMTSSYLLEDNGTTLLMDMGAGTLGRLLEVADVTKIDAVWFSHLHYDHTSDFLTFRYLLEDLKHTITVYAHLDDSDWCRLLFDHPNFNVINVDESSVIQLGSLKLTFFEMKHTVPDYAVRIEGTKTFVYTGDTMYTDTLMTAIDGADCVLADCSKPVGFNGPHMTADKAIEIHKQTGIKIISTHLSPDYSPDEYYKDFDGIEVAQEMKTYFI